MAAPHLNAVVGLAAKLGAPDAELIVLPIQHEHLALVGC